jgi:hypothetical protein
VYDTSLLLSMRHVTPDLEKNKGKGEVAREEAEAEIGEDTGDVDGDVDVDEEDQSQIDREGVHSSSDIARAMSPFHIDPAAAHPAASTSTGYVQLRESEVDLEYSLAQSDTDTDTGIPPEQS